MTGIHRRTKSSGEFRQWQGVLWGTMAQIELLDMGWARGKLPVWATEIRVGADELQCAFWFAQCAFVVLTRTRKKPLFMGCCSCLRVDEGYPTSSVALGFRVLFLQSRISFHPALFLPTPSFVSLHHSCCFMAPPQKQNNQHVGSTQPPPRVSRSISPQSRWASRTSSIGCWTWRSGTSRPNRGRDRNGEHPVIGVLFDRKIDGFPRVLPGG